MILLKNINVVVAHLLDSTNVFEQNNNSIAIEVSLTNLVSEVTSIINNTRNLDMNNDEFNAFIFAILTKVKEKYYNTNKDISLEVK